MTRRAADPPDLHRLRRRIDTLDRRIVGLINERTRLGLAVGEAKDAAGWAASHDPEREREVLLRAATANEGPFPQADLLTIYRRIIAVTRRLEVAARRGPDQDGGPRRRRTKGR